MAVNIKKKGTGTASPSQQVTNATGVGTPGITNMSGVGSGLSSQAQAQIDSLNSNTGGMTTTGTLPGGAAILLDSKGLPVYYSGYAENWFANNQSKGGKYSDLIARMQDKLKSVNAYPANYSPLRGFYSQQDVDALNRILPVADQLKEENIFKALDSIIKNPKLSNQLKTGGTVSQKTLTSVSEAGATLTDQFLNVFNVKPTAAEVKAYTNAINAKEKSSKTALSSQERQDILLNVMNQKAAAITKTALAGDAKAAQEGSFGATVRSLRNEYFDNGVKVTDQTLYKQAAQAMRGSEAYNNIVSDIQINAKAMLPALSQYIDQGKKVRNILNSHIQRYADIYGVDPNTVDLNQIAFVANGQNLMSTTDMVKQLWNTDPKIKETQYYKDVVTNDARSLLGMIGLG